MAHSAIALREPPRPASPRALRARLLVPAALAALYVIWGSTYFAMAVALRSFPPFVMGALRFALGGAALYATLRARGVPAPTARQWGLAAATGFLLLAVGNGGVALAQEHVASSVAALAVATMPLWAAFFGALLGNRTTFRERIALALGFVGCAALHAGGDLTVKSPLGLTVLAAPVAWALGSMWSRTLPLPGAMMTVAAQMICAGGQFALLALLDGRPPAAPPRVDSVLALLYLTVCGSLVALTAYTFLLRNVRPALATSYAFVNPLVAIAIGVVLAGERLGAGTIVAAGLIAVGVALLVTGRGAAAPRPSPES